MRLRLLELEARGKIRFSDIGNRDKGTREQNSRNAPKSLCAFPRHFGSFDFLQVLRPARKLRLFRYGRTGGMMASIASLPTLRCGSSSRRLHGSEDLTAHQHCARGLRIRGERGRILRNERIAHRRASDKISSAYEHLGQRRILLQRRRRTRNNFRSTSLLRSADIVLIVEG